MAGWWYTIKNVGFPIKKMLFSIVMSMEMINGDDGQQLIIMVNYGQFMVVMIKQKTCHNDCGRLW